MVFVFVTTVGGSRVFVFVFVIVRIILVLFILHGLVLGEGCHINDLCLLQELLRAEVLLLRCIGQETQTQTLCNGADVELAKVFLTALLIGDSHVEGTQTLDLYFFRLQKLLNEAVAVGFKHSHNNIHRVRGAV